MFTRYLTKAAGRGDVETLKCRVPQILQRFQQRDDKLFSAVKPLFSEAGAHGQMDVLQCLCELIMPYSVGSRANVLMKAAALVHAHLSSTDTCQAAFDFKFGLTPLMAATAASDLKGMLHLIDRRAEVNVKTASFDMTALCFACFSDVEVTELLLDAGARDGPVDALNQALYLACTFVSSQEDVRRIALLIEARADVNQVFGKEFTPLLTLALQRKSTVYMSQACEVLLRAGANPEFVPPGAETVFGMICSRGVLPIVKTLVNAGADIDFGVSNTPVVLSLHKNYPETARFLVESGADISRSKSTIDADPAPPLPPADFPVIAAVTSGSIECLSLAAEIGGDLSSALPMWCAMPEPNPEILDFLIDECGLDQQLDEYRERMEGRLISRAAWHPNLKSVKRLLARGAEINTTSKHGRNAVCTAAHQANAANVKYLTLRGGDIHAKTTETGKCAIDFADDMRLNDVLARTVPAGPR